MSDFLKSLQAPNLHRTSNLIKYHNHIADHISELEKSHIYYIGR